MFLRNNKPEWVLSWEQTHKRLNRNEHKEPQRISSCCCKVRKLYSIHCPLTNTNETSFMLDLKEKMFEWGSGRFLAFVGNYLKFLDEQWRKRSPSVVSVAFKLSEKLLYSDWVRATVVVAPIGPSIYKQQGHYFYTN